MIREAAISAALLSAILFGATTPLAKHLLAVIPPLLLAGLLYLGSGVGLTVFRLIRDRGSATVNLQAQGYRALGAAILFGGVIAPVCLMIGLQSISASGASLLLNLESLFTALLAWWFFKENAGARVVVGMLCIGAGGVLLSWNDGTTR